MGSQVSVVVPAKQDEFVDQICSGKKSAGLNCHLTPEVHEMLESLAVTHGLKVSRLGAQIIEDFIKAEARKAHDIFMLTSKRSDAKGSIASIDSHPKFCRLH